MEQGWAMRVFEELMNANLETEERMEQSLTLLKCDSSTRKRQVK